MVPSRLLTHSQAPPTTRLLPHHSQAPPTARLLSQAMLRTTERVPTITKAYWGCLQLTDRGVLCNENLLNALSLHRANSQGWECLNAQDITVQNGIRCESCFFCTQKRHLLKIGSSEIQVGSVLCIFAPPRNSPGHHDCLNKEGGGA